MYSPLQYYGLTFYFHAPHQYHWPPIDHLAFHYPPSFYYNLM